jgi:DNA-binding response OmpR family regulator
MQILVIEDNERISASLSKGLTEIGYQVNVINNVSGPR